MASQPETVTFDLPPGLIPASKKNSREWSRRGGRPVLLPSARSGAIAAAARAAFAEALGRMRWPCWPTEDVGFALDYWPGSALVRCRVEFIRPEPEPGRAGGTGRRRDLQNMPEAILDALEGLAFTNDRQVARVRLDRHHPSDEPPEVER